MHKIKSPKSSHAAFAIPETTLSLFSPTSSNSSRLPRPSRFSSVYGALRPLTRQGYFSGGSRWANSKRWANGTKQLGHTGFRCLWWAYELTPRPTSLSRPSRLLPRVTGAQVWNSGQHAISTLGATSESTAQKTVLTIVLRDRLVSTPRTATALLSLDIYMATFLLQSIALLCHACPSPGRPCLPTCSWSDHPETPPYVV